MISFNVQKKGFSLINPVQKKEWLKKSIQTEGKVAGEINYIFCDDDYLAKINYKYLKHNTLTDIITFPYSNSSSVISGDVFISIDRVNENAVGLNIKFETELARVLIHGVLHLVGYNDHSNEEKRQMRSKEDYYLNLLPD